MKVVTFQVARIPCQSFQKKKMLYAVILSVVNIPECKIQASFDMKRYIQNKRLFWELFQ